jgi:hypothetical protein
MKNRVFFLLGLFLLGAAPLCAEEHPACQNLDYRFERHSAPELRQIAASCTSAPLATLYSYRAEHLEMVEESEMFASMLSYSRTGDAHSAESYRIYIGLIESFAPLYYPEPAQRVAFLNSEYERVSEIAELRLMGYDNLADRLERELRTP